MRNGSRRLNWKKACATLILCGLALAALFNEAALAETITKRMGTVQADSLNVRSAPGTESEKIGTLTLGTIVEVLEDAQDSKGDAWHLIQKQDGSLRGYVHGDYITIQTILIDTDAEYEAYLTEQGFPESYREQLHILHAKYPNWIFTAKKTNLAWETVVYQESNPPEYPGISLVSGDSISSWKSTADNAYDWTTSTWYTHWDSGNWVLASDEIVQYYLDPRNFLDETYIFLFMDQKFDSALQTVTGIERVAGTSFLAGNGTEADGTQFYYPEVLLRAGSEGGVNPYVLAASIRQEMGNAGTSDSISGTNEKFPGIYNYYNIGAYKTDKYTAIERGLWYASGGDNGATTLGRPWNTRYKAIAGGALHFGQNYVNVGQNTLYYKRFNVVPTGTNTIYRHQFMTNIRGAASEAKMLASAYDETARQEALLFEIPVYENMPAQVCSLPTKDGSPNNKLQSLSVEGYTLTPTFDMNTNSYSLIVPSDISAVSIAAQAYDQTAAIAGTGQKELSVGSNSFDIAVTAQNGDVRSYTIIIAREEPEQPTDPTEPPTEPSTGVADLPVTGTPTYVLAAGGCITGIQPGTTAGELPAGLDLINGATAAVTDSAGTEKASGTLVATGDRVSILRSDGSSYGTWTVVIYGDVSGDGRINMSDLIKVRNHILETNLLTGDFLLAGDVSRDGKVNMSDLIKIRNHILETNLIVQ